MFSRFHVFTGPFPRPNVHFHVFTFHSTRFHGQMCIFTFCAFTKYISRVKYVFSRFYVSHGIVFPKSVQKFFPKLCLPKNIGLDIDHQLNSFKGVRRPVAEKINWKTIKTTKLTITENTSNLQTFHICSPNQTHIYIYILSTYYSILFRDINTYKHENIFVYKYVLNK